MGLLTIDEIGVLLFKMSQGVVDSNTLKQFFEEQPFDERIWTERSLIPNTAPTLAPDGTSGVVQYKEDLVLSPVPGNPNAFTHSDLADSIHFKHGDGSYNWTLKDSSDNVIPQGSGRWLKANKSQILYFYGGAPANMPPKITFYRYVGAKDVFGGGSGGSGDADNKYRGVWDPTSGALPTNGSGPLGVVKKGDYWRINQNGTLSGLVPNDKLSIGDVMFAAVDGADASDEFFAVSVNVDVSGFAQSTDARFPTAEEKAAMQAGENPSNSNPFITQSKLDTALYALGQFVGDHDASGGTLPTTGSGAAGAIVKGDYWRISVAGTITGLTPFEDLNPGDVLTARVNAATNPADFFATEGNLDFASKANITDPRFPTQDEKDALAASTNPSTTNPVITQEEFDNQNNDNPFYRGNFDASGALPTTGSALDGTIRPGDHWRVTVNGTVAGLTPYENLQFGDILKAIVAAPTDASGFTAIKATGITGLDASEVTFNASGEYANVEEALLQHETDIDNHQTTLDKLIPAKPQDLSGLDITMALYQALEASTGAVHECTDDTTPDGQVDDFYDGDSGELYCEVDSSETGRITIDTNDQTGASDGDLTILADEDPYAGEPGRENFWKQLTARIRSAIALSIGSHTYQMMHTVSGNSSLLTFFVDDPVTGSITAFSVDYSGITTKYISGVPSASNGDSIAVTFTIVDAVRTHYNQNNVGRIQGAQLVTVLIPPPGTPPANGASILVSAQDVDLVTNQYAEQLAIAIDAINSAGNAGTQYNNNLPARIDEVSDESGRLIAGSGQYPGSGYGGAFDSTQSLKTVYTEELQLLNGKYGRPAGNYTANQPTAGEDYSSGMGTGDRWVLFDGGALSSNTGFTVELLGAENFTGAVTTGVQIQVKIEGVTGWLDANSAYGGVGDPVSDGDACLVFSESDGNTKVCTLGSTPRTGQLYVRIGLPDGSNKKLSGISITNLS